MKEKVRQKMTDNQDSLWESHIDSKKGIHNLEWFVIKIVLTYREKNCSSDLEKNLKVEAESREFSKLRSLEQFIQTVKGQNKF